MAASERDPFAIIEPLLLGQGTGTIPGWGYLRALEAKELAVSVGGEVLESTPGDGAGRPRQVEGLLELVDNRWLHRLSQV